MHARSFENSSGNPLPKRVPPEVYVNLPEPEKEAYHQGALDRLSISFELALLGDFEGLREFNRHVGPI